MDYDQVRVHFEKACRDTQDPSHRVEGEKVLLDFKSSQNTIPASRYILEHSQEPLALFHAVLAIKESVLREFTLISKAEIQDLQAYLLQYCLHRPSLLKYVLNQILQVIAIIVKRSYLSQYNDSDRHGILVNIRELISHGESDTYIGVCYALALIDEFSSTKASIVNLTWTFHNQSKDAFEQQLLKPIFESILQVLADRLVTYNPNTGATTPAPRPTDDKLLEAAITVAERILSWDFEVNKNGRKLAGTFSHPDDDGENKQLTATTAFPPSWADIILHKDVIEMFFALYVIVQDGSTQQAHRTRQCLIQLAGVNDIIFKSEVEKQQYTSIICQGLVRLMQDLLNNPPDDNSQDEYGPNILSVSQMIRRLIESCSISQLKSLPDIFAYLTEVAKLTSTCLKDSVAEVDGMLGDITWSEEAAENLMAAWVKIANDITLEELESQISHELSNLMQFLSGISLMIFETFVNAKLDKAKLMLDEEEIEMETEYKDWELYSDQLVNIAALARLEPHKTIDLLTNLLKDRFERLKHHASYKSHATESGIHSGEQYLDFIHEHIHWLVLISAYVLADEGDGEKPMVPDSIMALSCQHDAGSEDALRLASLIFEVLGSVSQNPETVDASNCSPRVAETLFYFVERWSQTYLLIDVREYRKMSSTIAKAYTSDGQGKQLMQYIVEKIHQNFAMWTADPDVLLRIINVLTSFGKAPALRSGLLESPQFPKLVSYLIENLTMFPEFVHNPLIQAVTIILSGAESGGQYLKMLTDTIETGLQNVIQRPDFVQTSQNGNIIAQIVSSLEMFEGLALGVQPSTNTYIFDFCSRFLDTFVKLVEIYRTRSEVVLVILEVFYTLTKYIDLSILNSDKLQILYDKTIDLLKAYSTVSLATEDEEEPHRDVSIILTLLDNFIASDFESLDNTPSAKASEVVFYGIHITIPTINFQMLELPHISIPYVRLIAHLVEFYPDKLTHVPPALYDNIMGSLEWATHLPVYEAATTTYQAITPLALYYHNQRKRNGPEAVARLDASMQKFLSSLMETLLFQDFDVMLIDPASETLVSLIVAQRQYYESLVGQLLALPQASQPDTHDVLIKAFERLTEAVPQDLPEVMVQAKDVAGFRQVVYGFLMDSRGVLRRK